MWTTAHQYDSAIPESAASPLRVLFQLLAVHLVLHSPLTAVAVNLYDLLKSLPLRRILSDRICSTESYGASM